MRKSVLIAATLAASLGLAACSEKTQENAENTMQSAGDDISAAATTAGDAVEAGASAAGDAAERAADSADRAANRAADKTADKAAEVEANVQNEPVSKAKAD